ncbi:hypothetical protein NI389_13840 [Pseudoalteromonas xiamenensis]|uniref:hypothetical protein n=1 Tax=Pseudoalteromonas xiamenensis TaxID=882626 RepID=UPI0027E3BAF5|nr:hypothetical protein [Pseudoalteromonas xiamenensis]WMN59282.1 hypothetical protein NI389_13840 [Pseudoalteromonas xiamenensis]
MSELERQLIGGELRGSQAPIFTQQFFTCTPTTKGQSVGYIHVNLPKGILSYPTTPAPSWETSEVNGYLLDASNKVFPASCFSVGSETDYAILSRQWVNDLSVVDISGPCWFIVHTRMSATFDTLPNVDIAGHPSDLANAFPNGCYGEWIPNLPSSGTLSANQKIKSAFAKLIRTGGTWYSGATNFEPVANNWTDGIQAGEVQLYFYSSDSYFTEPETNLPLSELGNVIATADFHPLQGNRLSGSLLRMVLKDSQDGNQMRLLPMLQYAKTYQNKLWRMCKPRHGLVDLNAPSYGLSALKTLVSIIEKNGLYYAQFNGSELKHNGTDWGDDQVIPVISGEDVKVDLNGNTVKAFCHHSIFPLGIAHNG